MTVKNNICCFPLTHPQLRAALLALCPVLAQAQVAPAVTPSAGTILQQIQTPGTTTAQPPSISTPKLSVQGASGVAESPTPGVPFMVSGIDIVGNTVFDTATLQALVAPVIGKKWSVKELTAQVGRITDYYKSNGYFLSRAIIPIQKISDGVVRVQVVEARYDKIIINNKSRVSASLLESTVASLQSGELINSEQLDPSLLKLSDIPGLLVDATMTPGETVLGATNLVIDAKLGLAILADVAVDNYGNDYTGQARIGGTVNAINPLHYGDVLSATLLTSGTGMNYGRLSYESLINGQGNRMGASYSALRYVLGKSLEPLNAHGTARVASVWLKHPLLRDQERNINGHIQYDNLDLRDHIDATQIQNDRQASTLTATLSGDVRDRFDGMSLGSASWTGGRIDFDNANAQLSDAATAKTGGSFYKLNLNLSRMQRLTTKDNIYLSYISQWSDSNLDASQKMTAGGVYTVRAYNMGAVSGDSGYVATAEWRRDVDLGFSGPLTSQFVAFIDHAHLTLNKAPWLVGANGVTMSGYGAGFNFSGMDQWKARVYVTGRLGAAPQLLTNTASTRAWIEISTAFSQ